MEKILQFFLGDEILKTILNLGIRLIIITFIYLFVKRIINKIHLSSRIDKKEKTTLASLLKNIIRYLYIIFCALFILDAFGIETKTIVASIGVAGLVIGLSLQDIIKDFIAGMFIILENQYNIGDYVTIGSFKGKVISLGLKTTKVESLNGEIKTIPNRYVDQVVNHSLKNQVLIIDIPVTNEYDVTSTKQLLESVCTKLSKELKNIKSEVKLVGINSMNTSIIEYRIKVEVLVPDEEIVKDQILSNIIKVFKEHKQELISAKEGK